MRKIAEVVLFIVALAIFSGMVVYLVKEFPYWGSADFLAALLVSVVCMNLIKK